MLVLVPTSRPNIVLTKENRKFNQKLRNTRLNAKTQGVTPVCAKPDNLLLLDFILLDFGF